jgi:hypothetical protein
MRESLEHVYRVTEKDTDAKVTTLVQSTWPIYCNKCHKDTLDFIAIADYYRDKEIEELRCH